jgi:cold shock CspA family protein
MRIAGSLSKWNDDRGFGFIAPAQGGQEIFVHISAFPKDGVRPTLGEKLTFEIETDNSGRMRAIQLQCPARPAVSRSPTTRRPPSHRRKEGPSLIVLVIPPLVLLGLGLYGYGEYSRHTDTLPVLDAPAEVRKRPSSYRCDGRTHCSQMTSCAEATFFLRNCPGAQMDGNHDGEPCEQQWCTSPFAR